MIPTAKHLEAVVVKCLKWLQSHSNPEIRLRFFKFKEACLISHFMDPRVFSLMIYRDN